MKDKAMKSLVIYFSEHQTKPDQWPVKSAPNASGRAQIQGYVRVIVKRCDIDRALKTAKPRVGEVVLNAVAI